MASTMDSFESLNWQITSLWGAVPQNGKVLDSKTAEQEGNYIVLGEECCFYVNESELVEQMHAQRSLVRYPGM